MFIETAIEWVNFLANKELGRSYNPTDITKAINNASLDMFQSHIEYYKINKVISTGLRNFLVISPEKDIDENGIGSLPADYEFYSEVEADGKFVDIVQSGWWQNRVNDPIEFPTKEYPIAIIYKSTLEFRPTNLEKFKIHYFKTPKDAVYGYIYASDEITPIFDESKSTDIEWPRSYQMELFRKTLTYIGLNLKDADLLQFEGLKKQLDG